MENRFSCFDPSGAELEFDDGQDRKYDCDHTHNMTGVRMLSPAQMTLRKASTE